MAARVAGRTSSALTIAVFALVAVVSGRAAADPSPPKHPWLTLQRFMACGDCHQDAHHGEFAARNNGECAGCHTVDGFAPTTFGVVQHASTGYALDGQHAATPCNGCHPGPKPRLGWQLGGTECLDCHQNPHGTQFAKEMTTGGCATCHVAYSWHQVKVDHSSWPLVGAHARTACEGCHGAQPQGAPPSAYRGVQRNCEGCHEDSHAAQFRQAPPIKTCESCHLTETWKIAKFDHDKTRYPLEGAHVKLECAACHPTATLRDGQQAVRWRLGYIKCKDCHADPHAGAK